MTQLKTKSRPFVVCIAVAFVMLLTSVLFMPYAHAEGEPKITLTYSSDANGSITEWLQEGDLDRNGQVDQADYDMILDIIFDRIPMPTGIEFEAADLNTDDYNTINSVDMRLLDQLIVANIISLPSNYFTFRVVDTPNPGYMIYSVSIINSNGGATLTPWKPTSGGYTLSFDENGVGTITGPSVETNNVIVKHMSSNAYMALTADSDEKGSISSTMLKGDADGNSKVDYNDISALYGYMAGSIEINTESADCNLDNKVNALDISKLYVLFENALSLPNTFSFKAVDAPKTGYMVNSVTITSNGNTITLTPDAPFSGNYALSITDPGGTGIATVTGPSYTTNDVHFTHVIKPDACSLTYGNDTKGTITEWMLKGDPNRDGRVNADDLDLISDYAFHGAPAPGLVFESADLHNIGSVVKIDSIDMKYIAQLVGSNTLALPNNTFFNFRVIDTPNENYVVASARITTPDDTIILTKNEPTSGDYALAYDENGVATVTGPSLGATNVFFTHIRGLSIPVTKEITGTPKTDITFSFLITANELTPDAPLPEVTICNITGEATQAFGPITYDTVGNYYYNITEINGGDDEYAYDESTYIVLVEVSNGENDSLVSEVTAIWKNEIVNEISAKLPNVTFTNTYTTVPGTLTLSKTVTGELANKRLGFKFTVTFTDDTYNFNAGAKGTITGGTGVITLRHGESVTFKNLPAGIGYTIVETNGDAYVTTVNNNGTPIQNKTATGTVERNASVNVAYTNNLVYTPIVGVVMNTIPFILFGLVAFGSFACIVVIKKRKTNKETL